MYGDQQDPRLQQLLAMMMGGRGGITPASLVSPTPPGMPQQPQGMGGQYGGPGLGQYGQPAPMMPDASAPQQRAPNEPDMGGPTAGGPNIMKMLSQFGSPQSGATSFAGSGGAAPAWGAPPAGGVTDWGNNTALGHILRLNQGGANGGYARGADRLFKTLNLGGDAAKAAGTIGTASQAAIDSQLPGAAAGAAGADAATTGAAAAGSTGIIGHILSWLAFL